MKINSNESALFLKQDGFNIERSEDNDKEKYFETRNCITESLENNPDTNKILTISDLVGDTIDLEEKKKYHLFPYWENSQFKSAWFIEQPDGKIIVMGKMNDGSMKKMPLARSTYDNLVKNTFSGGIKEKKLTEDEIVALIQENETKRIVLQSAFPYLLWSFILIALLINRKKRKKLEATYPDTFYKYQTGQEYENEKIINRNISLAFGLSLGLFFRLFSAFFGALAVCGMILLFSLGSISIYLSTFILMVLITYVFSAILPFIIGWSMVRKINPDELTEKQKKMLGICKKMFWFSLVAVTFGLALLLFLDNRVFI